MALVLAPEVPLPAWLTALDAQMGRSPNFFDARPVVIDLGGIPREQEGVAEFLHLLEQRGIRIIGTEGAHPSWTGIEAWGRPLPANARPGKPIELPDAVPTREGASSAGQPTQPPALEALPPESGSSESASSESGSPESPGGGAGERNALVLDQPVRSGQSVVFERGDVTVLGSVASGAEVMAGGSVHIYGTLRGRAIAGLGGNSSARIFCSKLQAELLAIDGVYQTADDMPAKIVGKAVQVWLDGEQMKITVLD
jgi:septum site-determining protein MinC